MSAYTDAYAQQVKQTPGLNPDPYAVQGTSNGVSYNFAGDPITYDQAPASTSSASSAPARPPIDYAAIAQYDQGIGQVNAALGNLPGQQQSANSKIESSYQDALSQLLSGESQAHNTYDTNTLQNKQDYVGSKNTIRSQAGGSLNGLLRLLGSRGAGGGSAATITAPGAVARVATQQQSDVGNTYGHNSQNLDTNWGNYEIGVNNQRSSAAKQREEGLAGNQDAFSTQKANLLNQLAQLSGQRAQAAGGNATGAAQPYLDQVNSLLSTVGKFNYTPINYQTQAYTAPNLDKYTFNPNAAPTYQGQTQSNDYTSPYLAALLGKKQQQGVTA